MEPREKEAAFMPIPRALDETTGLPTVLWAEELGCALKGLACRLCPRQRNSTAKDNFVALEVMNDSSRTSPALRKGEVIFPLNRVRVCAKRIDC